MTARQKLNEFLQSRESVRKHKVTFNCFFSLRHKKKERRHKKAELTHKNDFFGKKELSKGMRLKIYLIEILKFKQLAFGEEQNLKEKNVVA